MDVLMLQNVDYDLIIVGGGIAGSALAVSLAQTGRSILILEKDGEFRDRIRGGGCRGRSGPGPGAG